jgi:hypothetical protein
MREEAPAATITAEAIGPRGEGAGLSFFFFLKMLIEVTSDVGENKK